jgi:hypothetical protein
MAFRKTTHSVERRIQLRDGQKKSYRSVERGNPAKNTQAVENVTRFATFGVWSGYFYMEVPI